MWSFATHAGAGMAIAGLTATYYALSRRNYQGERERLAHESGFGDGPQVNRLRKHGEIGQLTSSHMLLKKELEELSLLNGSSSGLNILYQQKSPLHRFNKSNFEITPIVSRVDTRASIISLQDSEQVSSEMLELETSASATGTGESVFGSDPDVDNASHASVTRSKKIIEMDELPVVPIDIEKYKAMQEMVVNVDELGAGDVTAEERTDNSKSNTDNVIIINSENESESGSQPKEKKSVGEMWKAVQDNQFLKRNASPICFFKNPGFGNRFAVNVKEKKPSPLVATLSSSNVNLACEKGQDSLGTTIETVPMPDSFPPANRDCQNSTQFILTPALSQSNVSVCEADNPEKMLIRKKRRFPEEAEQSVDTNPVEEMSEYNKTLPKSSAKVDPGIRLRADPANSNLCPPRKRRVKPVPITPPTEVDCDQKKDSGENERGILDESKPELNENVHKNDKSAENEKVPDNENVGEDENIDGDEKIGDDEKIGAGENVHECVKVSEACKTEFTDVVEVSGQDDKVYKDDNVDAKEKIVCENEKIGDCLSNTKPAEVEQETEVISVDLPKRVPSPHPVRCRITSTITQASSLVTDIPSDSWISLPVRIYTNSMRTLPWPLIGICVMVVIIAGFLGIILTSLANNVRRRLEQD